ncbi:hypothetical protein K431DRAFT_274229 [Polychaeton citri CBS 116435]|uniref:Pep3/Vps18/deep orange domain-containing protein n=1 Tax=Polychaeton citri CBS 116435 TaxID=1314669 RepID=A0A9P4UN61_9PEZI|nr:hypothetical protein K431DRAFT_274229 [Polychaeton citri CBS 116435]
MASGTGYVAGASSDADALPIFDVQRVQLRFDISAQFVAAAVANNVLILALSTGRILRFDLDNAEDIDDIDLPKRPAEIGVIKRLFLDPSASHLIISTALGENYYLHTQSRTPKQLGRLRGVQVESIAWCPSLPTASTREILVGAADGHVYETYIEPTAEFYRNQEKFVRIVWSPQNGAVVGLHADVLSSRPETRRVVIATPDMMYHFAGKVGKSGHDGSIYGVLFDGETPTTHAISRTAANAASFFTTSPLPDDTTSSSLDAQSLQRAFAWLNSEGVYTGPLLVSSANQATLGRQVFHDSHSFARSDLPPMMTSGGRPRTPQPPITAMTLTQFHVAVVTEGRLTAFNRLNNDIVYNQNILEANDLVVALCSDPLKNTYWLFTQDAIYELVATDEARHVWRILLEQGKYDEAQRYARTSEQKDAVASMTGDNLIKQGKFMDAATVLGRSSKPFEDVALSFIDKGEHDALRKYLLTKLSNLPKQARMQRVMLASWLIELYMSKLNQLDDTISTRAELAEGVTATETSKQLPLVRKEFQEFASRYKDDLDKRTTYEIISSHGREEELLHYANITSDLNYVLSYWIQRERWDEALAVLKKQTEPDIFYKYATVLMAHVPQDLVEVLMRQGNLDAKRVIPALLNYNKNIGSSLPISQNQAIRYLNFCINHDHSTEAAVHNTLISLLASHPTRDESQLLSYLQTQSAAKEQNYDADFALRLCIAHKRVQSCVHIYTAMQQYSNAVDMALKNDETDLAAKVADGFGNDEALRKKLWLRVAKAVIAKEKGVKSAINLIQQTDGLLRIEDLIPFFPDFVIIDDFKEEICAALESYSSQIDALKREMDSSAETSLHIKQSIRELDNRYAIVEPGERCWSCRLPLLMRQFFVFPCQHAFHADCLGEMVMKMAGMGKGKRIRELQREIGRGVALGKRREKMVAELDALVAGSCVLCSEMAIRMVDEPFIGKADDRREWAI